MGFEGLSSFFDLTYHHAVPLFVLAGKEFWRLGPSRKGVGCGGSRRTKEAPGMPNVLGNLSR
jgi:hypothetical protein